MTRAIPRLTFTASSAATRPTSRPPTLRRGWHVRVRARKPNSLEKNQTATQLVNRMMVASQRELIARIEFFRILLKRIFTKINVATLSSYVRWGRMSGIFSAGLLQIVHGCHAYVCFVAEP